MIETSRQLQRGIELYLSRNKYSQKKTECRRDMVGLVLQETVCKLDLGQSVGKTRAFEAGHDAAIRRTQPAVGKAYFLEYADPKSLDGRLARLWVPTFFKGVSTINPIVQTFGGESNSLQWKVLIEQAQNPRYDPSCEKISQLSLFAGKILEQSGIKPLIPRYRDELDNAHRLPGQTAAVSPPLYPE